eukprot:s531_g20.t1
MKLWELLLPGPRGAKSIRSSFSGGGMPQDPYAGGVAGADGATGGDQAMSGHREWWQDESGHWHFGGPAEHWWRDEHHQWHPGGSQLWRQDENGNWHEVKEDHLKSEDEKMMAGLDNDMGEQEDDIKDLDDLNHALKDDMPPMDWRWGV